MKKLMPFIFGLLTFYTVYANNPEIEKWNVFELTLTGPSQGNPFEDVELKATFSQKDKKCYRRWIL